MKKPSFFVVGAKNSENTKDIFRSVERLGCHCNSASIADMVFFYDKKKKKFTVLLEGKDICAYDIFIFRSYSKNLPEACILAEYLNDNGKTVIDSILTKEYLSGKMLEANKLAKSGLPQIQTLQALKKSVWEENLKKLQFPIIVKPISGSQGKNVQKIDNYKNALIFFQENPKGYLAQEYVPIDGDVRVLVVGGKALGAMKRFVVKGDVRSNASIGAETEKVELTKEMEKIALEAAKAKGLDIAGVDIIQHGGKLYILEVNSSPQWQAFKKATGINPAEHIASFAFEQYQKTLDKIA